MNVTLHPGASGDPAGGPGRLVDRMRAALHAWSAAREDRRLEEHRWRAAIADAHALAERGRAMSREAADRAGR